MSRDSTDAGGAESASYTNSGTVALTVFVIIDTSQNQAGSFTIAATVDTPAADEVCEGATPLTSGTVVTGTTVGYVNDYQSGTNCRGTLGPDRVYSIEVAAGATLATTATPTGTPWDVSLNLVVGPAANCSPTQRTCAAAASQGGAGQPEAATYHNTTANPQTVFIFVESPSPLGAGTFTLLATVTN